MAIIKIYVNKYPWSHYIMYTLKKSPQKFEKDVADSPGVTKFRIMFMMAIIKVRNCRQGKKD